MSYDFVFEKVCHKLNILKNTLVTFHHKIIGTFVHMFTNYLILFKDC